MPASHPDRYTVDQPALSQQDSQLTRQPVQSACSVCLWSVCNASAAPGTPSPARHSCQSPSSPWLTAGHPAPTCTPWCPYSSLSVSLAWSQSTPPLSFCVILSLALFLSLKLSLSPSLSLGLNLSHSLSLSLTEVSAYFRLISDWWIAYRFFYCCHRETVTERKGCQCQQGYSDVRETAVI